MSNQKIVYYSNDRIKKENADIYIVIGERSNGKSYSVKHEEGIMPYIKNHDEFIYLRRIQEEISSDKIEQYFADVNTKKITEDECNCITQYRKQIYLSNYDLDTNKTQRRHKIGYAVALSTEQNYAGRTIPKC